MKITITLDHGEEYEQLTVDPRTLVTTDSTGEPVVLFPNPGERDMTTLEGIMREALYDDTRGGKRKPARQFQCCTSWLEWPTRDNPVTCPECNSFFELAEKIDPRFEVQS